MRANLTKIMADQLLGNVSRLVDEFTLEINISWKSPGNEFSYEDREIVRLSGDPNPEVGPAGATHITHVTDQLWKGAHIQCNAQARDKSNRVSADVWLL